MWELQRTPGEGEDAQKKKGAEGRGKKDEDAKRGEETSAFNLQRNLTWVSAREGRKMCGGTLQDREVVVPGFSRS